jgi:thiamine-phosphate pyrophosphorylase
MKIPKLYPIVDRATLNARGIGVGAFAAELAAAGVGILQYRDKVSGPQEVLRAAAEISAAFAGRECLLVMNDRADLTVLAGWSAVHVGQGDLSVGDARAVMGVDAFVGVSTHTAEDARVADAVLRGFEIGGNGRDTLDAHPNEDGAVVRMGRSDFKRAQPGYVAVGPVFATSTKADAEPIVGLDGVRRARALTKLPLVAIGGITRENARSVLEAGADSVAVIGALMPRDGMSTRRLAEELLELLGG